MPIHDWTRVDAGLFHDFHQDWTIELRRSLNAGRLPPGFMALTDQQVGGLIPDVLTLHRKPKNPVKAEPGGGLAVATAPSGDGGHVNLSPKGLDTLRILSPTRVAYLDLTGSGVETIAHLRDNGRITLMACAFEGAPRKILGHSDPGRNRASRIPRKAGKAPSFGEDLPCRRCR